MRIVHGVGEPPVSLAVRPELLRSEKERVRSVLSHLARGAGVKSRAVWLVRGEPAVALLDAEANGIVLSSLFGRSDSRVYGKSIKGGKSEHTLSLEEREAVDRALRR